MKGNVDLLATVIIIRLLHSSFNLGKNRQDHWDLGILAYRVRSNLPNKAKCCNQQARKGIDRLNIVIIRSTLLLVTCAVSQSGQPQDSGFISVICKA